MSDANYWTVVWSHELIDMPIITHITGISFDEMLESTYQEHYDLLIDKCIEVEVQPGQALEHVLCGTNVRDQFIIGVHAIFPGHQQSWC